MAEKVSTLLNTGKTLLKIISASLLICIVNSTVYHKIINKTAADTNPIKNLGDNTILGIFSLSPAENVIENKSKEQQHHIP